MWNSTEICHRGCRVLICMVTQICKCTVDMGGVLAVLFRGDVGSVCALVFLTACA